MKAIATTDQHPITSAERFDDLAAQVEKTVAATSARIYRQTFNAWRDWCGNSGVDLFDMRPANVTAFLADKPTTKATRQRQLSALRKLAQMAFILAPTDDTRRIYEALKLAKAPTPEASATTTERHRRALTPAEADKLLRQWDEDTPLDARNRALVAVLLLGGVRRSEAAALRWKDIDLENGVIHIRHGKGDKARDVPLAGDFALDCLRRWQMHVPSGRAFVFCHVERGGHVAATDAPISGKAVYEVWQATAQRAGVDAGGAHNARRSFITEALATGAPLATVQAIAGHARGDTTLGYAQATDARRARKELKLRYG